MDNEFREAIQLQQRTHTTNSSLIYKVPVSYASTLWATVELNKIRKDIANACSQHCSKLTDLPCRHMIAAAHEHGNHISVYMNIMQTTKGWRQQYNGVEFSLPDRTEINDLVQESSDIFDPTVTIPPDVTKKIGNRKKKASGIQKGFNKNKTKILPPAICTSCSQLGHKNKLDSNCMLYVNIKRKRDSVSV